MSRTQYDIHTKELYTRESIENIISEQCRKNGFPVPDYTHGYLSKVAKSIGITPTSKTGNSFAYLGKDAITIINKVVKNRAKKKGETKLQTKTSPSKVQMVKKPSQISIDDISRNSNFDLILDKLRECIGIIETMKEMT